MSSFNPDDWDSHWAKTDSAASLNPAQSFRHKIVTDLVDKYKPNSIVDIGSGQGDFLQYLQTINPHLTLRGIELSKTGTELTRSKVQAGQIVEGNLLAIDFNSCVLPRSDIATCIEVIEHLDSPTLFLKRASELIAPDGILIITVPSGPRTAFDVHIGHRKHFNRKTLKDLLEESGFKNIEIKRYGWPFFNLYRTMVLLRGKRLIQDVENQKIADSKSTVLLAKAFGLLFRLNVRSNFLGWQLVATCRNSGN